MLGHIYMLFCHPTLKYYVGKSIYPFEHQRAHWRSYLKGEGTTNQLIRKAIAKYGSDAFSVVCLESDIPKEAINVREKYYIHLFHAKDIGYNSTDGGDGLDSEIATEINNSRVANGTHPWLSSELARENNRKRIESGEHLFTSSDWQRENQYKRVKKGDHPFLGGELQKERIKDGTHHLLKKNRPPELERQWQLKAWRTRQEKKGQLVMNFDDD